MYSDRAIYQFHEQLKYYNIVFNNVAQNGNIYTTGPSVLQHFTWSCSNPPELGLGLSSNNFILGLEKEKCKSSVNFELADYDFFIETQSKSETLFL